MTLEKWFISTVDVDQYRLLKWATAQVNQ